MQMPVLSINTNFMAANTANTLKTHYSRLATSVERLSSGLRVNSAADDAAGLAIRELMRADVATFHQGVRNANDAISMIQTADGALAVIDEKLIRMKELAEQAATGTYNSTQRLIIHSEFQQMAMEIERIAHATDFNGIKLLDGSLAGEHNGSGLNATGKMKIHFGTGNDSAEDYYYVEIGNCTLAGLGLRDEAVTTINAAAANAGGIKAVAGNSAKADPYGGVPILSDVLNKNTQQQLNSGCIAVGIIPAGSTGINIIMDDNGQEDTIQIFTRSGKHLAGIQLADWFTTTPITESTLITEANGFSPGASYDGSGLNGTGNNIAFVDENTYQNISYNGMNIGYTCLLYTSPSPRDM